MSKKTVRRLSFDQMYELAEYLKQEHEHGQYIGLNDKELAKAAEIDLGFTISESTIATVCEAAGLDFRGVPTPEERIARLEKKVAALEALYNV